MKNQLSLTLLLSLFIFSSFAQSLPKSENLVLVTLDGLRWQEVFGGIDTVLVTTKQFTQNPKELYTKYFDTSINSRRSKLFPFIW
jgi:uncharacterized protein YccT (UPF0319 family)